MQARKILPGLRLWQYWAKGEQKSQSEVEGATRFYLNLLTPETVMLVFSFKAP